MSLITARAPGERGIRHYISEWAYLGGGVVRAECGLWSSTWQITPEKRAEDCRRCVAQIELHEAVEADCAWGLEGES